MTSLDPRIRSKSTSGLDSPPCKYDPDDLLKRIMNLVEENKLMGSQMKDKEERLQALNINLTEAMLKNQK